MSKETGVRALQRIRNRSAKGVEVKHPDFIYNWEEESGKFEFRSRANSWSSNGAAVVELRKKVKEPRGKSSSRGECDARVETKWRQQKINTVFQDVDVNAKANVVKLQRTSTSNNLTSDEEVVFKVKSINRKLGANAKETGVDNNNIDSINIVDKRDNVFLSQYGSDFNTYVDCNSSDIAIQGVGSDTQTLQVCGNISQEVRSATHCTTTVGVVDSSGPTKGKMSKPKEAVDPADMVMEGKKWDEFLSAMKDQLAESVKEAVKEIKSELVNDTTKLQENITKVEGEVSGIEIKNKTLEAELNKTKTDLKTCQLWLNEVVGVVTCQDHIIKECQDKIDSLQTAANKNVLRISGVKEVEKENVVESVEAFFKNHLKITQDIKIASAFRVGKGDGRPIVVQLHNVKDKGLIFKGTTNLKEVKNEFQKAYFVSDQLMARKMAEKNREQNLFQENKKKTVDKLKCYLKKTS